MTKCLKGIIREGGACGLIFCVSVCLVSCSDPPPSLRQTYVGYDVHRYEDAMARQARLTMVRTYGQMPRKLFRSPHPHVTDRPQTRREPQVQGGGERVGRVWEATGRGWGGFVYLFICHISNGKDAL